MARYPQKEMVTMRSSRIWIPLVVVMGLVGLVVLGGPMVGRQIARAAEQERDDTARLRLAQLGKHDQLSALFRQVAAAVKPAVVEVRTERKVRVRAPQASHPFEQFFPEGSPFRFRSERQQKPRSRFRQRQFKARGFGSGVVVDAAKGYVLTNYHVVAGAHDVEVVLPDKRKYKAQWVRRDSYTDLAIIKIDADGLTEAPLGDSDQMEVGDWVLAVGAPWGFAQTVTAGIISAKGTPVPLNPSQRYIQTDAAINKGNSGGPLVNVRGEVIGINWAIRTASGGYDGIGFAIPSNVAKKVVNKLVEGEEVVGGFLARGFLGVEPQDIGEQMALSLKLPDNRGAIVTRLVEGGPADKAGLKVFDFVIAVGDTQIGGEYELRQAISAMKPGTKVDIEFYRKGERQKVQVEIGQRPETVGMAPEKQEPSEEAAARFGLAVETLTAELAQRLGLGKSVKGVLIVEVHPDSDAYEKGLREGMVVTHVGWNEIGTAGQFADVISSKDAAKGVTLRVVKSGGRSELIFITVMGE